jgi:hypothetical protein
VTLSDLATADITVENHGSVVMLRPMTRAGLKWIIENVEADSWQWLGNALACEPRMVQDVIDGAEAAGLKVAA